MYTPHGCGPSAARAVSDVPSAIAVTRLTNAHANSEQLVIILISFVFIIIASFCLSFSCFGLLWLLIVRSHFRPFTEVQNGKQREVTGEMSELRQTKGNKEREVSVWFRRSKESLCFLCCLLLAEKYHRARNRQHTRAGASPQTEKQSAATQ